MAESLSKSAILHADCYFPSARGGASRVKYARRIARLHMDPSGHAMLKKLLQADHTITIKGLIN